MQIAKERALFGKAKTHPDEGDGTQTQRERGTARFTQGYNPSER